MYNLKYNEAWNKTDTISWSNESLLLKYIIKYGNNLCYEIITNKKKLDSLSFFEYISPEEYNLFKKNIEEPTKEEKRILNKGYIGSKLSWILNNKLRLGINLSNEENKIFNILNKICYKNRCGKNCILKRFVDLHYLSQYNITFDKFNENSAKKALTLIKDNLVHNVTRIEKGFMSDSYGRNGFSDREILLLLYCPFGIRMYVTDNDAETEVIFQRNMKYVFVDSYLERVFDENLSFYRIVICCYLLGGPMS